MVSIADLTREEQETHLNMTGDDHNTWYVYSDDPYWIRRLDKIAECIREEEGGGKHYKLDKGQVSIRKRVQLSKKQREELRARALKNFSTD